MEGSDISIPPFFNTAPPNDSGLTAEGFSKVLWAFIAEAVMILPLIAEQFLPRTSHTILAASRGFRLQSEANGR